MPSSITDPSSRRTGSVFFGALFSTAISQSFIFAVLPVIGRRLGISDFGIGLAAGLPALGYVLAAPILGSLVDRIGSLLLVRIGLIAGIASNLIFACTILLADAGLVGPDITLLVLLLSRTTLNVAWGGLFPAATAYVARSTATSRRIGGIALLESASAIGLITGPIIPALLADFSLVAPFYVVSSITSVSLLSTCLVKRERVPFQERATSYGSVREVLTARTAPYFAIAFLLLLCLTLVQQIAAFQMQDSLALSSSQSALHAGQLLSVTALTTLLAQWTIAAGMQNLKVTMIISIGTTFGCLSMLLAIYGVWEISLWAFYLSFALFGGAMGILLPTNSGTLSLALPQAIQGQAAGFRGSAQGIGRLAGPLVAALLYAWSPTAPYWFGAIAFGVVALLSIQPRAAADPAQRSLTKKPRS